MLQPTYDALVIGGGPGGSAAATFLARAGRKVLLLEKEHFPRFHIGESLLPYNRRLFEEMGVLPAIEAAGFPRKYGAQFHLGNASKSLKLVFSRGRFTRETTAFQVERAQLDDLLLKHARVSGAEVREGWRVTQTRSEPDQVVVQAQPENGPPETFRAAFLIDASGRTNFTGNQEGLRVIHPQLRKLALFGHFEGVALDAGLARGDTHVVRLENKWFWLIPISPQKTSVGCVMDQSEFGAAQLPAAELFARLWQSSTAMRLRMANAQAVGSIQTTGDFSYYNRKLVDHRLIRVGDAAGFMDPIFSAGVYLAMVSAKWSAQIVVEALAGGNDGRSRLAAYEKRFFRAMWYYWRMVEEFYTTPFIELFMEPRPKFNLPDAILAVLAGELDGGLGLAWRRRLFLWMVKFQGIKPFVPTISFAENPSAPASADADP